MLTPMLVSFIFAMRRQPDIRPAVAARAALANGQTPKPKAKKAT